MSTIPSSPQACGSEWLSQDDPGGRQNFLPTDHAPLSPQSSVASSGSEQTEEQGSTRNTFQEDGSGMKGQDRSFNLTSSCHRKVNNRNEPSRLIVLHSILVM